MSTLLQCYRISHHAGTRELFSALDLTITSGDRIGLVGYNGCGKSTLLGLLAGHTAPDEGEVARSRELLLETVEQFIDPSLEAHTLEGALIEKLPAHERAYGEYRAARLLEELGFEPREFGYRVADLSGGQQNRLMFARAVINGPNFILFDEPTNHLDLTTTLLFEDFLTRSLNAGFIVISHDRHFLDAVTNRTLFLRDGRLHSFALPYSRAAQELAVADENAIAARRSEERTIQKLKASAKRLAIWGKVYDNEKLARKAKNMEKRVARLEENKTFVTAGPSLQLSLDIGNTRADRMLQIEDCPVVPPGGDADPLFHVEHMWIRPGDRVALLGVNGVGKTTLIREIIARSMEEKPIERIRFNPQCRIGYYDQEQAQLDPGKSLLETLRDRCSGSDADHSAALIHAGFPYEELGKQVAVLSGGERARLLFLVIRLNEPNFLILDEPTNHIDIAGREELEAQILDGNATALITSHDRRFIENVTTRYLLIDGGVLREIHDPADFYRSTSSRRPPRRSDRKSAAASPALLDEEEILARIVLLEEKLAADLARKSRHQKPLLQREWQEELTRLQQLLE